MSFSAWFRGDVSFHREPKFNADTFGGAPFYAWWKIDLQITVFFGFSILPWSSNISWHYRRIYRALAAKGHLIGTNEVWIAATALVHGRRVVTNNMGESSRVPGLTEVAY